MSLSLAQNFVLFLVKTALKLLASIESLKIPLLVRSVKRASVYSSVKRASVYSIVTLFVLFLIYSYTSGYLFYLASGFVSSVYEYGFFSKQGELQSHSSRYYPVIVNEIPYPGITARSAIVVDNKSSKVLYELNSRAQIAPASTNKLMTALVASERYSLDEEIEISAVCADMEGTKAYFPINSRVTVRNLLGSMLVSSAGDSACALATGKIEIRRFVDFMNEKALEFGMVNTHFDNPVGLDGNNYSTAEDLYKMGVMAMRQPTVREFVKMQEFSFTTADGSFENTVYNTNKLLWEVENSVGIKTGTTENAGEVLIYNYNDGSKDIVIVVMGSEDRFLDTKTLLNWTLDSYSWN